MTTNFPSSLDSFTTKVDGVDEVLAAHVNNLQDAVVAIETSLGSRNGVSGIRDTNPLINGIPVVWQAGASFAAIADGTYLADMWNYRKSGLVVHTVTQDTSVPTVAEAGVLIPYSIKADVTTVDAAIAAGDYCYLATAIEGYNWLHLAQRQFTLGFWVKAAKTGTHCVAFVNSGSNRTYVAEYTISVADTWEYKTVTVSASPTAGTWSYTTGLGIRIRFALSCGTTYQTTAGAWQTGDFIGTSNQVNETDNTANNFFITGVTITPGPYARPIVIPDFQQEVARCQRYFWKSFPYTVTPAQATGNANGALLTIAQVAAANYLYATTDFPVLMRTSPTLTTYNPHQANANWRDIGNTADKTATTYAVSDRYAIIYSGDVPVAGSGYAVHLTANARL